MRFTSNDSVSRYGRYRIISEAGTEHLDDAALKGKDPSFLFNELSERLAAGPVRFAVKVQLAEDGDVVDDATVHWPETRPVVTLGTVNLDALVPDN